MPEPPSKEMMPNLASCAASLSPGHAGGKVDYAGSALYKVYTSVVSLRTKISKSPAIGAAGGMEMTAAPGAAVA